MGNKKNPEKSSWKNEYYRDLKIVDSLKFDNSLSI